MANEVTCEAPCNFRLRSENDGELVSMVQQHAKNMHNMDMSRDDVMGMAKPA
jgi:predicted small metal-binding protein